MENEKTFWDWLKWGIAILIPISAILSPAVIPFETLYETANHEGGHLIRDLGKDETARWVHQQKHRYSFIQKNFPLLYDFQRQKTSMSNGGASNIKTAGFTFSNVVADIGDIASTSVKKIVFTFLWITWPRFIHWMWAFPLFALFIGSCFLDAHYRRKEKQHEFFVPLLWRTITSFWLMNLGVGGMIFVFFWGFPLYEIVPVVTTTFIGFSIIIWRSIPLVGR